MAELCDEAHPEHPEVTCIKPKAVCFVRHQARKGPQIFEWDNPRPRPAAEPNRPKAKGMRDRTNENLGIPPEAEDKWRVEDGSWLRTSTEILRVLLTESPEFRTDMLWRQVVSPAGDKRMMSVVVKDAVRNGWIQDTGQGVRPTESYRTLDGERFPLNKLVPIYRSMLYRASRASATIGS